MATRSLHRWLIVLLVLLAPVAHVNAIEWLNLDSIAAKGRFARFCIDTYRWGDQFFNGYDTVYVAPTGYKFNVKLRTDSWLEYNTFRFDNNSYQMDMVSYPSTSMGVWLTYMAVSAGYDVNVSQMLGLTHSSRKRFNFQFNCMLFAADLNLTTTDSRMRINRFGPVGETYRTNIPFNNIHGKQWAVDLYYFFNHKHYSQSAAFSYSRLQRRSSGSLYAGLSLSGQNTTFDFSALPIEILKEIPQSWPNYRYNINVRNYAFKLGYGYNIVLSKHWMIGLSEAPTLGIRHGYINEPAEVHNTFYAFNRAKASVVYNNDHWFAGIVGQADTNLFSDHDHTLLTNYLSAEVSVGYRFNLW